MFNFFTGFKCATLQGHPTSEGLAKNPPLDRKPAHEVAKNYLNTLVPVEFDRVYAMEEGRAGVADATLPEPHKEDGSIPRVPSAPKKTVSIKDVTEEICIPKKKKNASKQKVKETIDLGNDASAKAPKPLKPILKSASNINERSDAFIRRRKETLRSHSDNEPKTPF